MYRIGEATYEAPGLGDLNEEDPHKAYKMAIAKWTGVKLEQNYPGYAWFVRVEMSKTGGLVLISLPHLMGDHHYYACQVSDVISDPGGKRTILKGAGELLERFGLRRGKINETEWREAVNNGVDLGKLQ